MQRVLLESGHPLSRSANQFCRTTLLIPAWPILREHLGNREFCAGFYRSQTKPAPLCGEGSEIYSPLLKLNLLRTATLGPLNSRHGV